MKNLALKTANLKLQPSSICDLGKRISPSQAGTRLMGAQQIVDCETLLKTAQVD